MSGDDRVEITLAEPIMAHGERVGILRLRRPKVKHLRAAGSVDGPSFMYDLLGVLADIPPVAVDEIGFADFARISEVIRGFLGATAPPISSTAPTNAPDSSATSPAS